MRFAKPEIISSVSYPCSQLVPVSFNIDRKEEIRLALIESGRPEGSGREWERVGKGGNHLFLPSIRIRSRATIVAAGEFGRDISSSKAQVQHVCLAKRRAIKLSVIFTRRYVRDGCSSSQLRGSFRILRVYIYMFVGAH